MLTKNGKIMYGKGVGSSSNIQVRTLDGDYASSSAASGFVGSGCGYLTVGSGTNDPTYDDYTLQTPISDLLVVSKSDVGRPTSYSDNFMMSMSTTFKNTTANPITVRELGLCLTAWASSAYPYQDLTRWIMVAREIIDPVEIQPNEIYTFTMTIGGE